MNVNLRHKHPQKLAGIAVICALFTLGCPNLGGGTSGGGTPPVIAAGSIVEKYGTLKVEGTKITDKTGKAVALRGISLGWHNWWPRFYNAGAVKELKDKFNATVIRVAMGVNPGYDETYKLGYLEYPNAALAKITPVIDACIAEGLYVIIDWHTHDIFKDKAVEFFGAMSKKYGHQPNVIYEIYNEPTNVTWDEIKAYAVDVITAIRKNDLDNIIIVGTPWWSGDVHVAAASPITGFTNIAYTKHFYAEHHVQWARDQVKEALEKGVAVFVTECGGMQADGDGPINKTEWKAWTDFMDANDISWVAWSISDKDETCSMLTPQAPDDGNWTEAHIKEWGKLVRESLKKYSY